MVLGLLLASINLSMLIEPVMLGLQLLEDWQNYFHQPQGTALGIFKYPRVALRPEHFPFLLGFVNAAQNLGSLVVCCLSPLGLFPVALMCLGHSLGSLRQRWHWSEAYFAFWLGSNGWRHHSPNSIRESVPLHRRQSSQCVVLFSRNGHHSHTPSSWLWPLFCD
jgi:hypothetical protein